MSVTNASSPAPSADLFTTSLSQADPEIAEVVGQELGRQRDEIELIASENIVSRAVLEAQGSVLTNKYAEGLSGPALLRRLPVRRHRRAAGDRARRPSCSAASFANVQPHSGAQANAAAFMALMQPGDTFMGLNLAAGGHLTPRLAGQHVGQVVQGRALQRAARRPAHRHGRGGEARRASTSRR